MYEKVAILGIETTGKDPAQHDVVDVAVILLKNGDVTSRFSEHIYPSAGTAAARGIGITADELRDAREADPVIADLIQFIPKDTVCITHDASNMLAFLEAAAPDSRLPPRLLDTHELAQICFPRLENHDLEALTTALELAGERTGARWAMATCERITRLWDALVKAMRELPPVVVREINQLLKSNPQDPIGRLFRRAEELDDTPVLGNQAVELNDLFRSGRLPKRRRDIPSPDTYLPLAPGQVESAIGPDGPFAARLPGYEYREQQGDMAGAVVDALNRSRHLLVEAGTGIGKSIAYLVPALLWAATNKTPVVISTNTKNLQGQLFRKDLPLILECLDASVTVALIKGRQNYLCLRKLRYLLKHATAELDAQQRAFMAGVLVWAAGTDTGDLSESVASENEASRGLGTRLYSSREECRGPLCSNRRQCFLYRARRQSLGADIVVANHAVVLREIGEPDSSPVLPPYAHIVFDEAHNLEDAATSLFSTEVSLPQLRFSLRRLCRPGRRRKKMGLIPAVLRYLESATHRLDADTVDKAARHAGEILTILDGLDYPVESFFEHLASLLVSKGGRESVRIRPTEKPDALWAPITNARALLACELDKLALATQALADLLKEIDPEMLPEVDDFAQDLDAVAVWLKEFTWSVRQVLDEKEDENGVVWVERMSPRQGNARAWSAPISVAQRLAEELYARKQSVIFTSATLTVSESFDFVKKRLGIDRLDPERLSQAVIGTPFDYARQCLAMAPTFLPEPGDRGQDYARELGDLLAEVFRHTRGRGMVLFTSFDMLRRTGEVLEHHLAGDGVQVLSQGSSGSRESITEVFKRDFESVLLGVSSFWEGVDVVGESLSCLVVARLPFAVFTDPVVEARCEQIEAEGGNAFTEFSLPTAVIRFRQGFGRLVRHRTDRGIVIVTDRRIVSKRYGGWFRRSLPVRIATFPDRPEFLATLRKFFESETDMP